MAKRNNISPKWIEDTIQSNFGVIQNFTDNSYNSDQESFYGLQDMLSRSAESGILFENPIVTTRQYSIPLGALAGITYGEGFGTYQTNVYNGGVLTEDGTLHLVPARAQVGAKISNKGILSTYAILHKMALTPGAQAAYVGGVLAPDGSVHFLPYANNSIGQKVKPNGSVSTYSLQSNGLTATNEQFYNGGVLGPNGYIYVIPHGSNPVGLRIDPSNDTSITFNLVYTQTNGYAGGVLGPDGAIHMVPARGNVGQKIITNGSSQTIVTYPNAPGLNTSLATTGGTLAPDGTIYFIPFTESVGLKLSPNSISETYPHGIIETFALAYTSFNLDPVDPELTPPERPWNRAILGSDGAIHFSPFKRNLNDNIGQKSQTVYRIFF